MSFLVTIFGLLFVLFIPGFLITQILFKKSELLEKILLTVLLSIGFYVILGIFLGFNETMKNITGGLSKRNIWIYSIVINLILVVVYFIKSKKFSG
jgi:uncharacterized membrane protein